VELLGDPEVSPEDGKTKGGKKKANEKRVPRHIGQITKRGSDKYLIRVFMGRDPATGKRHYHTETVHGKKAQAEDHIREILTKLKTGEPLKVSVDSFSSFIDEWMEGMIFKLAVIRKKIQGSPMVGVELPKDWDEGEEDRKDFGFILTSDKSDPFAQHQLRNDCNRILTKAGLPQSFNPYTARHTMASLLIEGGTNVKAVSERLGHSRVGITLDTYTHASEGMQREVSDDIERILSGDK
jgi:hypothetical protein